MQTLRKNTLAIVTALGLGLAATGLPLTTWADRPDHGPGAGHGRMMHHGDPQQRAERMKQHHEERMELLEYRLKLTPEQKNAWDAFKSAQTAHWASRGEGWRQRASAATAVEFFDSQVRFMEQHLTTLKALDQAARNLYNTLTSEQKTVLDDFFTKRHGGPGKGPGPGWGQPDDD